MSYPVRGDRVGRGRTIYDNITGGEMMIVSDENPESTEERCVTLMKSGKTWWVWDVDEGFKSADKELQAKVEEYNRQKNLLELQDLEEQAKYEESFHA